MADNWWDAAPIVQQPSTSPYGPGARGIIAGAAARVAPEQTAAELATAQARAQQAEADARRAQIEAGRESLPPEEQRARAARAAESEILAKATAEQIAAAKEQLPTVRNLSQYGIDTVANLLNHPGFSAVVGVPDPYRGNLVVTDLPGSDAVGARALLNQVRGQAFLQAFESIKGGGAISEREGEAATNAITRMQSATSEADFKAAAQDFMNAVARNVELVYNTATQPLYSETLSQPQAQEAPMARGGAVRRDIMSLRERYGI
jgi:hypothetical protein